MSELAVALALPAQAQPRAEADAAARTKGLWGADGIAACRDEDGVNRMEITGKRLFWYETRCRALSIDGRAPAASWTMRLSCEGEGQRFRARPRLSLAAPDRLVMEKAPVGPTKRQVYLRCPGTASPGGR